MRHPGGKKVDVEPEKGRLEGRDEHFFLKGRMDSSLLNKTSLLIDLLIISSDSLIF